MKSKESESSIDKFVLLIWIHLNPFEYPSKIAEEVTFSSLSQNFPNHLKKSISFHFLKQPPAKNEQKKSLTMVFWAIYYKSLPWIKAISGRIPLSTYHLRWPRLRPLSFPQMPRCHFFQPFFSVHVKPRPHEHPGQLLLARFPGLKKKTNPVAWPLTCCNRSNFL